MLNNREIKMLDIFSSGEEVSIKKLKEKFDISERMVRYDIDKINFVLSIFNIKPIYRNKSGTFKLDSNNKINKIKVMVKEAEPIDIEKRKKLIKLLLLTSVKKTNVSNLMDKFDTSRITINNDLNIIKKEFKEKGIFLNTKKGIILEGKISDLIKYRVETISECLKELKKENKTNYRLKIEEIFEENHKRLTIKDVEIGVNYAMIISTNAGLWAYNIGDTIQFVSKNPYRIIVSGRIKHYISAFGEHIIAKEVEEAIKQAIECQGGSVVEFSVSPQVIPPSGELPYHERFIEFETEPSDLESFAKELDNALQKQNVYYFDLIQGKVLQPLKITKIRKNGFADYMKSLGKLGGQNKIQRLANDRTVADKLTSFKL